VGDFGRAVPHSVNKYDSALDLAVAGSLAVVAGQPELHRHEGNLSTANLGRGERDTAALELLVVRLATGFIRFPRLSSGHSFGYDFCARSTIVPAAAYQSRHFGSHRPRLGTEPWL